MKKAVLVLMMLSMGIFWANDAEAQNIPIESIMRTRTAFFIDQEPPVPGKMAWNAHQQAKIYSFTRKPGGCQTKPEACAFRIPGVGLPISPVFCYYFFIVVILKLNPHHEGRA
jgi:hypothetical protein